MIPSSRSLSCHFHAAMARGLMLKAATVDKTGDGTMGWCHGFKHILSRTGVISYPELGYYIFFYIRWGL